MKWLRRYGWEPNCQGSDSALVLPSCVILSRLLHLLGLGFLICNMGII